MTECSISSDCIMISCRWVIDKHDWIVRNEYSMVDSSSTAVVAVVDSDVVSSGVRILKLETGVDCCLEADEEENKRRRDDDEDDVEVNVSDEFADTSDSSESEKIGVLAEASDFNAPRSE